MCWLVTLSILVSLLVFLAGTANGLECYVCDSNVSPSCGETFTAEADERSKMLTECQGEKNACFKRLNKDTLKQQLMVTRGCWSTSENDSLEASFFECSDMMKAGTSCFCKTSRCNDAASATLLLPLAVLGVVVRLLVL
ncbi:hypothetical protein MAR_006354 [Mya arenaria]|uniref:Protein sleepless n=1 Tax=Mya arenaria TaxID=6604 RepID=A0ABY7DCS1_MYAAR|nr:uncharacterized protein LOC128240876 [Mya arenaria]WAQ93883.1 hypothetical protein MAR_006354 [Mya arenaria]